MTFRGFIIRIVTIALITWILGSNIDSFGWGLYCALLPFAYYEAVRSRPARKADQPQERD